MKNFNRVNRAIMAKTNFCKSLFLILAILTIGVGQMWAGAGYNDESHVYLNVNGTTKYYKVSTESWSTGSSLPGTWGGVLKDQTFNNVLYIQVKGGAVGGWTENGGNISGNLYYKVTNNTTTPSSGWTTIGNINANYTSKSGNNCFRYKNDYSVNVTPQTPGTYYLHIKITDGASNNRTSYVKIVVPSFTVAGTEAVLGSDWDVTDTDNDMTFSSGTTYTLTKSNVTLSTGTTYECKVALDHSWGTSYPGSNKTFTVAANGHYDVTFSFDASNQSVSVSTTRLYAVIYNDNGKTSGSVPATSYHANGATVTVASNSGSLAKTGYSFGGWNTNSSGTGTNYTAGSGTFSMGSSDKNLYAKWNENMSTVSFVASPTGKGTFTVGGSTVTSTTAGVATTKDVTAVPGTGYTFGSWAITGGATISNSSDNPVTVTGAGAGADATLTCTFSPKQCTITFDKNGGANGDNGTTGTYDAAMPTIIPPTRDHYTFAGYWDAETDDNGSGTQYYNADGTSTRNWNKNTTSTTILYAKWTEITHAVRAHSTSGGSSTPISWTNMGEVTGGSVTASNNTGYHFDGWTIDDSKGGSFTDASSASTTFFPVANDTWITAHFAANTYSITLDKNGGESSGSVTATYNSGTLTSFSGAAYAGYSCDGYFTASDGGVMIIDASGNLQSNKSGYTDASGNWTRTTTPTTLYAHWTEDATYYTLNYGVGTTSDGHVTVSAAKTSDESAISSGSSLVSGTGITITATPAAHYKFVGWYTTAQCLSRVSTSNPYSFSLDANTNLYAKVELMTTTVTFNKNGGSGSTPSTLTATHGSNSLSSGYVAPTKTGYTFNGWYDDASSGSKVFGTNGVITASSGYADGSSNWTYTGTTLTVYAHWTAKNYTVTLDKQSGSGGPASVSATYDAAMPTPTTMPTRTGYDFNGYYGSTGGSGTKYYNADGSSAHVWDQASARTIYANWLIKNYSITYSPASAPTGCTYTTKPTSADYNTTVDMEITPSTGYTVSVSAVDASSNVVTVTPGASNHYTFTQPASAVTVTVTTTETMSTLTTSNNYDAGDPEYSVPSKSVSSIGISTSATLTATTPTAGYTFVGWTLSNNLVVTSGDKDEDLSITVHTNGNGAAATAQANYEEDLSSRWHLVGNSSDFPDDWNVNSTTMMQKKTEHSTESVVYCSVNVTSTDQVNFKIVDDNGEGSDIWYGYSTGETYLEWTATATNNVYSGSGNSNNLLFTPNFVGTYEFKVDYSGTYPAVTITYPDVNAIVGSFNGWNSAVDPLDFDGNVGTAEISIDGSTTDYEFKIIDHNNWRGFETSGKKITATESNIAIYTGGEGNNIALTADIYPSGDYTFSYNNSTHKLGVSYPTGYVVTYDVGTVKGQSNDITTSPSIPSDKKIQSGLSVTFTAAEAADGYTWRGWYTTATANPSDWAANRLTTSLAYTTTISAAMTIYAVYTANTYTVSFNVNGGTASTPDSKNVTYGSAYGELPGNMTHASKIFKGWYTASSGGTQVTAETLVSTASNHTLYAQYEDIFSVNVNFKCGDVVLYPATRVNASETALAAEISAPEILGYTFSSWTGLSVTFDDASSATTTVKATAATTITANYTAIPTVYFKNNLGWDSVFVTFDCSFIDGKQNVPSNNGHPYFAMTQLGSTDIFYCEIPSTYTSSDYAEWAWNIAFDNTNYGKTATTTHTGTWDFYGGECVGRGDFDPKATMFIPFNGDTETRNTATFYKTGCWMKYNSTDPGYQVKVNKMVTGANADTCTVTLTAPVAGGYEFTGKVWLKSANYGYGFKLYKPYLKNTNDLWYSNNGSIHSNTTTLPWEFATKIIVDKVEQAVTADTRRCELYTEAVGDYEFTVSFATGKPVVNVTYPVSAGDYRLVYNDNATWSNDAHDASWSHPSRVIKAKENAEDIVSFFIAYGSSPSIKLQLCTSIDGSGKPVWKDSLDVTIGATAKGIYNYKVTQNADKKATVTFDGSYDGNFYVRTDASDGGWSNYKTSGANTMTYSEYAEENSGFTHYFMRYVNAGQNIKFCIANDYSECISDTLVDDDYTNEWIEANGNVRFMWDHRTNVVSRAYISGSSVVSDRFLVLEGDAKMFDEDGNALTTAGGGKISGLNDYEMKFIDDQNWIYEATVKAQPNARIKLTAKYNNKIQYFYGDEGSTAADSVLLIGGSGTEKYKVRVVYDFKTNRLLKAFIPDGDITANLPIETDLMIIRDHQADAQQITFDGGSLSAVKTVYGAMKFNKWTVNNKNRTGGHGNAGLSQYERDLFYISFPFDVKLGDVFGFGTYGKHWIIEYYDGKGRAANGFWADSPSNWKFVMPSQRSSFTMKAFEGYILALDLDEMTESSSVWNNGVEDVYVYFPSTDSLKNIRATNRLVTIDQNGYECTINRPTAHGDRRVKDSYWHCIGVPSFANYSRELTPTSEDETVIDWTSTSMPYLYEVDFADKSLSITSSATFNFKATWSYLVQYAGASIYWSQVNATPSSVVARRANKEAPTNAEFCIELQQEGNKADQTFVRLTNDENVTTGFDFNYDLSKEFNRNKANIYTMVTSDIDGDLSTTETAGNCLPMSEQTTIVPMGVQIAKAGEYTISIPSGTNGVGVTLIDNETGLRTNLALEDYRVELDAATYNSRFIIEISPIVSVLTGVEQTAVSGQPSDVRKVIIDQKMYIIKDGKVYDAQGARIK